MGCGGLTFASTAALMHRYRLRATGYFWARMWYRVSSFDNGGWGLKLFFRPPRGERLESYRPSLHCSKDSDLDIWAKVS